MLSLPRVLLAVSSAILGLGGLVHGLAFFTKARGIIDGSGLSPFFASEMKVLWLADSTSLIAISVAFAVLTLMPGNASPLVILLLSLVPMATTALLYIFLGGFYAAHLLAVASILAVAAAITGGQFQPQRPASTEPPPMPVLGAGPSGAG